MKQIYIIEDGHGHKKIGMSGNMVQRLSQLKTAIPTGIMSVMVSGFVEDFCNLEKKLHEANKDYRLNGEWFREVIDFCGIDFSYFFIDITDSVVMTFQDSLAKIATDKELTGKSKTVLLLLMSELEFENYLHIKQVAIAEKLDMQKSNVSAAMKLLVNKGIILKVKDGKTAGYKLNPHYGWKGTVSNRDIEIDRIVKQRVVDMQKYRDVTEKPSA